MGEAKFSGRAQPVATPEGYPAGGGRFRIELTSVVFTGLSEDAQALRIQLWRPDIGRETMLRG